MRREALGGRPEAFKGARRDLKGSYCLTSLSEPIGNLCDGAGARKHAEATIQKTSGRAPGLKGGYPIATVRLKTCF